MPDLANTAELIANETDKGRRKLLAKLGLSEDQIGGVRGEALKSALPELLVYELSTEVDNLTEVSRASERTAKRVLYATVILATAALATLAVTIGMALK